MKNEIRYYTKKEQGDVWQEIVGTLFVHINASIILEVIVWYLFVSLFIVWFRVYGTEAWLLPQGTSVSPDIKASQTQKYTLAQTIMIFYELYNLFCSYYKIDQV